MDSQPNLPYSNPDIAAVVQQVISGFKGAGINISATSDIGAIAKAVEAGFVWASTEAGQKTTLKWIELGDKFNTKIAAGWDSFIGWFKNGGK